MPKRQLLFYLLCQNVHYHLVCCAKTSTSICSAVPRRLLPFFRLLYYHLVWCAKLSTTIWTAVPKLLLPFDHLCHNVYYHLVCCVKACDAQYFMLKFATSVRQVWYNTKSGLRFWHTRPNWSGYFWHSDQIGLGIFAQLTKLELIFWHNRPNWNKYHGLVDQIRPFCTVDHIKVEILAQ